MGSAIVPVGLVVLWSSGFIGAELGTRHAAADTLLMWRFLAATALIGGAWLLWRARRGHHKRPGGAAPKTLTRRALAEQALIGTLSQGVYLGSVVWAVGLGVPTGTSALIAALQPLAAGALAGPLLGERVTRRQWTGLGVGLAGVALVVRGDLGAATEAPAWAYALPFTGMAALLAASFLERKAKAPVGAVDALPVHCLTSAVLFTAAALATGRAAPPADPGFWVAVAWVVLLSTAGGYGFYWLSLRRTGVTRTSALIYLTPPTTMLWAYAMFGEAPGALALAGTAVCVLGVLAATWRGSTGEGGTGEGGPRRPASARARAARARAGQLDGERRSTPGRSKGTVKRGRSLRVA